MKMTMKKELNLKHGVILAAAVLLIAGCAFAGAAAAEPVEVVWSEELINSTGGDFIIKDLYGSISGLYQENGNPLYLKNDLILNFDYQEVRLKDIGSFASEAGVLGKVVFDSTTKPKLIIKNLIINGGELKSEDGKSTDVSFTNATLGSVIGCICEGSGSYSLENISIRNVSLDSLSGNNYAVGGIIGEDFTSGVASNIDNCSVIGCSILDSGMCCGGILGTTSTSSAVNISSVFVSDCYMKGRMKLGGIVGNHYTSLVVIKDSIVENCVMLCYNICGGVGAFATDTLNVNYSNVSVVNSVIYSSNSASGGIEGQVGTKPGNKQTGAYDVTSCKVNYCTIVGYDVSGGLIGNIHNTFASVTSYQKFESNVVSNTCVVAMAPSGVAAGFIAKAF